MSAISPSSVAALLLCAGLTWPAGAEEDLRQTVKELRSQVELLTARLKQLEQRLEAHPSGPMPDQPSATASIEKKYVEAGDIKGSIKIPGTDTSLAIGGYAKLDAIYNSESVGGEGGKNSADQLLLPGLIPLDDNAGESSQLTFHARQSRLWLKSHTPSQWGDLNSYLEMDFFAFQAPGDERVTNSYSPRLRHFYGSLGHFLAGQTWTTFMAAEALPELNDFGGPVGRLFVRQPQIRWTQPVTLGGEAFEWQLALEEPESTLTNPEGTRETQDDDNFPDVVGRLKLDRPWGSLSLATLLRNIRSDTASTDDNAFGAAVSFAGKIRTGDRDDLRWMLSYGNALGRYTSSNFANDGAIDERGQIELFEVYSGFAAYRHWWNQNWRSTVSYGMTYADNPDFVPGSVNRWAQSAHLNLLWSPILQTTFGLEYIYASRTLENDANGELHRIQFSSMFIF